MAYEFSKHELPPGGGYTFKQPQFGPKWENKMAMVGWDASVKFIISERRNNKAISAKHKLSTDYGDVENELERFTKLRLGIPLESTQSFFRQGSNQLSSRLVAVAADIKTAAQGVAVPLDWIQSGGDPVEQGLAERRAKICVACPKNVPGAWYVEAPAAVLGEAIKGWQKLKGSTFSFQTEQGDELKSCDVCKCLMRLKVFCPLRHIVDNTDPKIMAKFPGNCWIANRDR